MADGPETADDAPFQSTRSRKRRTKHSRTKITPLAELYERRRGEIEPRTYLDDCAKALRDTFGPDLPRRAVCLGLGGLRSPNSQLQLLLFEALTVVLDLAEPAVVFDPVFDEDDRVFLTERGFDVRTTDLTLGVSAATLCFLPHCPRSVNEALLRANWRPGELDRLCLVSNTFETYLLQAGAGSADKAPCIAHLAPHLDVAPLPHSLDPPPLMERAFADISFQAIRPDSLPPPDDTFWSLPASV